MKPIMEELEHEFAEKIKFEQIDVDLPEHQEKVQSAGVMSIPTFVIVRSTGEGEEELDRKLGSMPKEVFVDWINEHLGKE